MTASEFNQLVRDRRSVFPKSFNQMKIADEVIAQVLENANWAPTHKFTEPWRFVVFKEDGLKKFANYQAQRYKDLHSEPEPAKINKLINKPLAASHIIAVGMKRDEQNRVPEIEEIIAVGCAIQNIYLSISSYGIGGYFSTGGVTYDEEAKAFFGMQNNDKLLGFFYLGCCDDFPTKGIRKPVSEKIKWVTN